MKKENDLDEADENDLIDSADKYFKKGIRQLEVMVKIQKISIATRKKEKEKENLNKIFAEKNKKLLEEIRRVI